MSGEAMPIGRRGWGWARARYAAANGAGKGAIVAVAIFGALLYVGTALWFDVAYWILRRLAFGRFDRRARAALSVAVLIVLIAAIGVVAGRPAPHSTVSPSDIGAVMGNQDAETPQITPQVTPSVTPRTTPTASPSPDTASPSPTLADADDEVSVDSSPGASTTSGPTGVPIPLAVSGSAADRLPGEPDRALTPGALNPAVTQATIGSTICVSGWTATIRPSSSYTTRLKIAQIVAYGYSDTSTSAYEEDHLISLELGGAPSDPRNLWPQPYTMSLADGRPTGARTKDSFETRLKKEVCAGAISLAEAQADIGVYWVHAYYGILFSSGTPTAEPASAPPATAAVTAGSVASAGAPAPPVASLSVSITSLPASVSPGVNATLVALTAPGATCSASVRYASGTVSAAAGLKPQPVAGSSGGVSWTWKVGTSTKPGTSTATVSCHLGADTATAVQTFQVT
jgi:hypothetical protein